MLIKLHFFANKLADSAFGAGQRVEGYPEERHPAKHKLRYSKVKLTDKTQAQFNLDSEDRNSKESVLNLVEIKV